MCSPLLLEDFFKNMILNTVSDVLLYVNLAKQESQPGKEGLNRLKFLFAFAYLKFSHYISQAICTGAKKQYRISAGVNPDCF